MKGRKFKYSKHVALNRIIQGGAADQIKLALVALDRAGVDLRMTVHDEIDATGEAGDVDAARQAAQIMADVLPLAVPMVIDVGMGRTWHEAERVVARVVTTGHVPVPAPEAA